MAYRAHLHGDLRRQATLITAAISSSSVCYTLTYTQLGEIIECVVVMKNWWVRGHGWVHQGCMNMKGDTMCSYKSRYSLLPKLNLDWETDWLLRNWVTNTRRCSDSVSQMCQNQYLAVLIFDWKLKRRCKISSKNIQLIATNWQGIGFLHVHHICTCDSISHLKLIEITGILWYSKCSCNTVIMLGRLS